MTDDRNEKWLMKEVIHILINHFQNLKNLEPFALSFMPYALSFMPYALRVNHHLSTSSR